MHRIGHLQQRQITVVRQVGKIGTTALQVRNRFVSVVIPFSRISMQQLSGNEDSFERRFPVVQNHIIDVVENLFVAHTAQFGRRISSADDNPDPGIAVADKLGAAQRGEQATWKRHRESDERRSQDFDPLA